jgi:hypothetical protein
MNLDIDKKEVDEVSLELKKQILLLESMVEQYKDEMLRNYKMLNNIKDHIIRTNHLLINIRNIMSK